MLSKLEELTASLTEEKETGRYEPGECLGTLEELANARDADRVTMGKVLLNLYRKGYVTRSGRWYVAENLPEKK